ncbi:MAG: ABC transporter permease [Flavobacteriales bacterium AspAUS03]
MQKVWLIIQHEYLVQVRQKSFIIMTLLAPVLLMGLKGILSFLNQAGSTIYQVAVIDESPKQRFATGLKSNQNLFLSFFDPLEKLTVENRMKDDNDINALLVIPSKKNLSDLERDIQLYTREQPGRELPNKLTTLLNRRLENLKLEEYGINADLLRRSTSNVHLKVINIKSGTLDQDLEAKTLISIVMMYAVMMFILIYGVRIMRSVIEEKNSSIVEIIISSVRPFQLMIGKIFGTALVALTQFTIWIGCALLVSWVFQNTSADRSFDSEMAIPQLNSLFQNLFYTDYFFFSSMFFIYFIGGYLIFSAFFATIGSIMEAEYESQQYSILASIVLFLGFYGGIIASNHPTGWISFWLSMFPLTSPMVMLARIPYGIPFWQLVLSLSILFLSVWGMIRLAAKIYRVGILSLGGQSPLKFFFKSTYWRN